MSKEVREVSPGIFKVVPEQLEFDFEEVTTVYEAIPIEVHDEAPRGLPTDDKSRKGMPIFRGPLMYFPDALLAVAAVCKAGNDQHNPGEPMHWERGKSMEQMDTALRHMMDHGLGNLKDSDGQWHIAKAAWRLLAELQLTIEGSR